MIPGAERRILQAARRRKKQLRKKLVRELTEALLTFKPADNKLPVYQIKGI